MPTTTKRTVESLIAGRQKRTIRDDRIAGFQARLNANGTVTYLFEYRAKGGRRAPVRRLKVGVHGLMTADEAFQLATVYRANVLRGEDPAAARAKASKTPTLAEVADEFFTERAAFAASQGREAQIRASTLKGYRSLWTCHVMADLGGRRLDTITRADVDRLHRKISLRRPITANRARMFLYTLFREAAEKEHIPEGFNPARPPANGRRTGKWNAEAGRERYLKIDEIFILERTIARAEKDGFPIAFDMAKPTAKHVPKKAEARVVRIDPGAAAALRLLILTGARLREILHAKWSEVDFDGASMRRVGKGKAARTIDLSPEALAILDALPRCGPYVFPGVDPMKPRSDLNKPWALIRKQAGLDDVRLHDLRHSFATIAARNGISLQTIGAMLGHADVKSTAIYAHLDDGVRKSAFATTAAAISRAMEGNDASATIVDLQTAKQRRPAR